MVSIFFEENGNKMYPYLHLNHIANDTNLLFIINNFDTYWIAYEWWIKEFCGFSQGKKTFNANNFLSAKKIAPLYLWYKIE